MKYHKIIKKYTKLRGMPDKFAKDAIRIYKQEDQQGKSAMLQEFSDYINAVKSDMIIAEPVPTPKI